MVEDDGEGGGEVRGEEEEGGGVFWGRGGLVKVGGVGRGRTEASLGHEGVGVFQGGGAPFGVVKVIGEEFERVGLLVVPRGHAPEALEDGLFAEGEVEEGAVDGVLFVVALGVFVAGNVFELFSLGGG